MYRLIRDTGRKNPNPVLMSRRVTCTSSKQCKDYVFCSDCEGRLNREGEEYVINSAAHGKRFPLRDRLDVAIPSFKLSESVAYSGSVAGIDTEKLGYFALSMVWRGAIHEWPTPFGEKSPLLDIGTMDEPIRRYLKGETGFPSDASVIVHVCDDAISQKSILLPCQMADHGAPFEIITPGIHFFVFLGSAITPVISRMCCLHSKERILFRRDCSSRIVYHHGDLARSSKRSRAVISEWPD
jgi:hypothetical protein